MDNEIKQIKVPENGGSKIKPAYIVSVVDSNSKTDKTRIFITDNRNLSNSYVEFKGLEVTKEQLNNVKNWEDAVSLAKTGNLDMEEWIFPWQKIISIKHLTYKRKAQ